MIRLFEPGELRDRRARRRSTTLFDVPAPCRSSAAPSRRSAAAVPRRQAGSAAPKPARRRRRRSPPPPSPHEPFEPMLAGMEEVGTGLLDRLDAHAAGGRVGAGRAAADRGRPGHRQDPHADPPDRVPLRRAGRLPGAVPGDHVHPAGRRGAAAPARRPARRRSPSDVTVGDVPRARPADPAGERRGGRAAPRAGGSPTTPSGRGPRRRPATTTAAYREAAAPAGPGRPGRADHRCRWRCCATTRRWSTKYRARWQWIFVDEYQDVDAAQYELLRLLVPGGRQPVRDRRPGPGDLLVPRRGRRRTSCASPQDFTDARLVRLTRNYRSSAPILAAAVQAIAPSLAGAAAAGWTRPGSTRRRRWSGRYPAASRRGRGRLRRPDRSTSWSAGCRTARSTRAGSTRARSPPRHAVLRRHRGAVPHRRAGRADRRRADPGRHPGAEALARPAARPAPGCRRSPRELRHADGLGGSLAARVQADRRRCWPQRYAGPDAGRRAASRRTDVWAAVDLLTPLARRCGDDLARFLQRARDRRRGRRARPARRGGRRC